MKDETDAVDQTAPAEIEAPQKSSYLARAIALGGQVSGRQVIAPGPGHSRKDWSMSVRLDPSAPVGFLVSSFAGDHWQDCRDYVRDKLGLPPWEPGDGQNRTIPPKHIDKWDFAAVEAEMSDMTRTEDDLLRIQSAQNIWNEASEYPDQRVIDYLASRALRPPEHLFGSQLRYHAQCSFRDENTGQTLRVPCLIAAFRAISDDIVTGIHRIRVDEPERWPKTSRKMPGIIKRSAIKLGPAGPALAVGEGLETCLAALQIGYSPCWALGSVGNISFFPVLEGVGEIQILMEAGDASRRMYKLCGKRWWKARRKVTKIKPAVGDDINDALMIMGPNNGQRQKLFWKSRITGLMSSLPIHLSPAIAY